MNYTTPVIKKSQPDDTYKFQPLPAPSGNYPYHLSLNKIYPELDERSMHFHMIGDSGGLRGPETRQNIVDNISEQYLPGGFIYHLGDVVYHFGEAAQYEEQFFKPFEDYPGPIFAIAGNHDADVNPNAEVPYQSLDAFTSVFCDDVSKPVEFSGKSKRQSITQPNIYWTLQTPLATIISMYTNVPKYGVVTPEQQSWLHQELLDAPGDKMLIICLHHAPYSADINHGSSLPVIGVLEDAFVTTGVRPDIVFSGHVHNYQRFHQTHPNGSFTPYIVSGAGGFDQLHPIAHIDDGMFEPLPIPGITLENYCDHKYGFLQLSIEQQDNELQLTCKYYTVEPNGSVVIYDRTTVRKGNIKHP